MQINVVNEIWSYEESINPKVVFPTPLGPKIKTLYCRITWWLLNYAGD